MSDDRDELGVPRNYHGSGTLATPLSDATSPYYTQEARENELKQLRDENEQLKLRIVALLDLLRAAITVMEQPL